MFKLTSERKRSEIWGIICLCLLAFTILSLLSFDPKDPSFNSVSTSKEVGNLTGLAGSYMSDLLFQTFGLSAYLLMLPIGFLVIHCFFPTYIIRKGIRLFSFFLLIIFFCGLWSLAFETITIHDQPLLAGGFTGHLITSLLLPYFNRMGSYIIVLGGIACNLILSLHISMASLLGSMASLLLSLFSIFKRSPRIFNKNRVPDIREANVSSVETTSIEPTNTSSEEPIMVETPDDSIESLSEEEYEAMEEMPPINEEELNEEASSSESPVIVPPESYTPDKLKKKSRFSTHYLKPQGPFQLPNIDILSNSEEPHIPVDREMIINNSRILEQKLGDFNVEGRVVEVRPGPLITVYEFAPAPGIKVSKIVNLADDLALALSAISVRIVAPIPGKSVVGIELPNATRHLISLKGLLQNNEFKNLKYRLPMALGKTISGEPIIADLARMPHLLVAGATGAGKSVFLNSIICSLLFRYTPDQLRLLLIDPKMLELSMYDQIPHLLLPVVTDPKKASLALRWAVQEMDRRYVLMSKLFVRNIDSYNKKIEDTPEEELELLLRNEESLDTDDEGELPEIPQKLPFIVIVIDELSDLMIVSSKEVELSITRLAQMARAAGIHLVVATQRPSVDVITGLIKANFPARIAFQVSSKVDSRTILDTMGAEKLLGSGDMLYSPPGSSKIKRVHGAYVSDQEVKQLVEFLKDQGEPQYDVSILSRKMDDEESDDFEEDDQLYQEAISLVSKCRYASISMIQRRLRIGYNRAARMIEKMETDGIVSPSDGAKPREVLVRNNE